MNDVISRQAVLDIVDELSHQMTIEGYWSVVERVKALPSATCGNLEKPEIPQHSEGEAADCNLDCISRQAAIRVASGYCHPANIAKELAKLPSAQPERKTGRWIEQDDSWDGVYYECSACGEPWTLIDGTPWDNGMNFCPNCGADMRGEGEK